MSRQKKCPYCDKAITGQNKAHYCRFKIADHRGTGGWGCDSCMKSLLVTIGGQKRRTTLWFHFDPDYRPDDGPGP